MQYVALEGVSDLSPAPWGQCAPLVAGTLFIDVMTARNLELVKNALTKKVNNTLYGS